MAVLEEIFDEPVYGKGLVGDSFLVGMDPTRKRMAQHLGNIAELPPSTTRVRMAQHLGNIAELPKLRVRMSRQGPKIRMARRMPQKPFVDIEHPRAPHNMVIGGQPFEGGEFVDKQWLSRATPWQLRQLGMTPQQAVQHLATGAQAGMYSPSMHWGLGGAEAQAMGKKFIATYDMLPENMRDYLHNEDLTPIRSANMLQHMINLFQEAVANSPNGQLPTQREVEALGIAGKSVRGHYRKFQDLINRILGLRAGRAFAIINSVLSANTSWEEHTTGAFRLVAEWVARGEPKGRDLVKLLNEWSEDRMTDKLKEDGEVPKAYAQFFQDKKHKIYDILSNIDTANLGSIAIGGRGKTPEFSRAMFDAMGVPIDTHMMKFLNLEDGADPKKWINEARYGAYKALLGHTAAKMGWDPAELQEAAWATGLGIQLMHKHGFSADNVADFLTHGTVGQQWDMHHIFHQPEVQNALRQLSRLGRLEIPESDIAGLARPSPAEGGTTDGFEARGRVDVPDPEALRNVARRVPAAFGTAALGTTLMLPEGAEYPEGTRPQTPEEVAAGKRSVSIGNVRPATPEEHALSKARNKQFKKKRVAEATVKFHKEQAALRAKEEAKAAKDAAKMAKKAAKKKG